MSVSAIGDVLLFLPRVAFGTVAGVARGVGGTTAAAAGTGVYSTVASFVGSNVGTGVAELSASGIRSSFAGVGLKEGFQTLMSRAASMGPRGLLVLGGIGALGFIGVSLGAGLFSDSQRVMHELSRGHSMDPVKSQALHVGRLLSGAGMVGGGLMCFIPGLAPLGIPLAAASAAVAGVLQIARYTIGGVHMFNYPEMAPWPLNTIFKGMTGRDRVAH